MQLCEVGFANLMGTMDASLFTGKERDAETMSSAMPSGLDYFGARYFSAAQGRFTSPDPNGTGASLFDPQSWNAYSYTLNNPLRYVDPDGDVPIPAITGAVGAGVGALVGGGAEALNQYLRTGTIQWGKVGTAALGGAISGGIAGATFGIGCAPQQFHHLEESMACALRLRYVTRTLGRVEDWVRGDGPTGYRGCTSRQEREQNKKTSPSAYCSWVLS